MMKRIAFALLTLMFLCLLLPVFGMAQVPSSEAVSLPGEIHVFDLEAYLSNRPNNKIWQYDVINMVSALQGLVNRDEPQLYIFYVRERLSGRKINVDRYWFEKLRAADGFLNDTKINYITDLGSLLKQFREYYTMLTLWDPDVPATGNLAVTLAGTDSFLPIRHDPSPNSLFSQLADIIEIPPGERFTDKFTGVGTIVNTEQVTTRVKKNDSYRWAKELYLDTGLCSSTHLGFFLDPADWDPRAEGVQYPDLQNCMIVNHDYFVAKSAFIVDLDPWWDEVPTDIEPSPFLQGIDEKTLQLIMNSAYQNTVEGERIIRVGGFVPWWVKYSNYQNVGGKYKPAETVEEFISYMSAYNGIIDGGGYPFAALANASFYQHIPLQDRYFQNEVPMRSPLENKNYLLFVIGDFNSSSLLYQTIPSLWEDMDRGYIPIAWAISPLLSERVPHVFDYLYKTRTSNDYFVSGTAGAGLNYPNRFVPPREHSNLGNDLFFWEKIARKFYTKFDLPISVAANLDQETLRSAQFDSTLQQRFLSFSPHGVGTLKPFQDKLVSNVLPFLEESAWFDKRTLPMNQVAQQIHEIGSTGKPVFHLYRFNLASPTALHYLLQTLKTQRPDLNYEAVDPYTFFYLYRQHLSGGDMLANYYLPNFISDTIPREIQPGVSYNATITLRNDGWDTWNEKGTGPNQRYRITYSWQLEGGSQTEMGKNATYIDRPVLPGERITLPLLIETPDSFNEPNRQGVIYNLILHFEQENVRRSAIEKSIQVVVQ